MESLRECLLEIGIVVGGATRHTLFACKTPNLSGNTLQGMVYDYLEDKNVTQTATLPFTD